MSLASILGAPTRSWAPLRNAAQWTIGTALGLYFTAEVVALVTGLWWAIALGVLWALGLITFWTTRVSAIYEAYFLAELLLSGRLVPMQLVPHWAQTPGWPRLR